MVLAGCFIEANRQYSYSPTVLGRVGLNFKHECEAHAEKRNKYEKTAADFAELKVNYLKL